jgi:hypothetical protein
VYKHAVLLHGSMPKMKKEKKKKKKKKGEGMRIASGYGCNGLKKKKHKKKKVGLVGDIFNLNKQKFYFVSPTAIAPLQFLLLDFLLVLVFLRISISCTFFFFFTIDC